MAHTHTAQEADTRAPQHDQGQLIDETELAEAHATDAMVAYTFERMMDAERRRIAAGGDYRPFGPFGIVTRSDLVAMTAAELGHPARSCFTAHLVLMGSRWQHQEPAAVAAAWCGVSVSHHRRLLAEVVGAGLLARRRGGRGKSSIIARPHPRLPFKPTTAESLDRATYARSKALDRSSGDHSLREREQQQGESAAECEDCGEPVRVYLGKLDSRCIDCHREHVDAKRATVTPARHTMPEPIPPPRAQQLRPCGCPPVAHVEGCDA